MRAQNFNFAPIFFKMGIFAPKFCNFGQKYFDEKNLRIIFPQPKIYGRAVVPSSLPRHHWAQGVYFHAG